MIRALILILLLLSSGVATVGAQDNKTFEFYLGEFVYDLDLSAPISACLISAERNVGKEDEVIVRVFGHEDTADRFVVLGDFEPANPEDFAETRLGECVPMVIGNE